MKASVSTADEFGYGRAIGRRYLKRPEYPMTVESPLVRQWTLLRTLCARRYGATVKEMAEELGVSERTVRRDLETFQRSGFPLAEIVEEHGRKKWRVEPGKNQPGLTFTFD